MTLGELGFGAVQFVSGNYFRSLGVRAAVGRTIEPHDDGPEPWAPVAMIGPCFWERVFGGDPGVTSRTIAARPIGDARGSRAVAAAVSAESRTLCRAAAWPARLRLPTTANGACPLLQRCAARKTAPLRTTANGAWPLLQYGTRPPRQC